MIFTQITTVPQLWDNHQFQFFFLNVYNSGSKELDMKYEM